MAEHEEPGATAEGRHVRGALLANIRHDLRTPINAVIGYSEMLLEDATAPDQVAFAPDLQRIRDAGYELLGLVNEILDAHTIEPGEFDWERFGATVHHQLHPPINAVIGYSEVLLKDAAESGRQDLLPDVEKIHAAAKRFLALTGEIVHFRGVEAGPTRLELGSTDVSAPLEQQSRAIRTPERAEAEPEPAHHGLVLVVDDNALNRTLLSRYLERQGHTVAVADTGRVALEMIGRQQFDLVLLDIMLPEMDGYEVLAHLKADTALRDIPVIMISALEEIESVVRCIGMGAEDYLPKPFNPVLLRARIGACLEKKRFRDQELDYLRQVVRVTAAASSVESGDFDPASLADVVTRQDALGQLARVFQRMAREVDAREQRLRQQVQELRIEVDEVKTARQVAEITSTDYFQELQEKAHGCVEDEPVL
jgi:CheY-like chemotaxis protein